MKRLLATVAVVAALTTLALTGRLDLAATAGASPSTPAWLTTASSPLLDLVRVYPGASGGSQFEVANPRPQPVRFSVRVTDVAGDDNGCNSAESRSGDTTCGAGGGELEDDLVVAVVALDDGGTRRDITRGTLTALHGDWAVDPVALDRDEHRAYVLEYELPIESTNETQTDRVGFDLEVGLEQLAPPTASALSGGGPANATLTGAELASSSRPSLLRPMLAALGFVVIALTAWRRGRGRPVP